jgi:ubiquinone biosynthesis protein COQ9
MDDCNHKLQEQLEGKEKELSNMLLADRIASIVRMRLEMNVPVITKWASALSIQVTTCTTPVSPFLPASYFAAKHVNSHLCLYLSLQCLPNLTCIYFLQANPLNAATALKQRALLIDDIWHAAGDRSSDMDWYTKRALLGAVYMTAELYMLTDFTPGCGALNSNSICN